MITPWTLKKEDVITTELGLEPKCTTPRQSTNEHTFNNKVAKKNQGIYIQSTQMKITHREEKL